jgi:hypothetical protein
VKDEPEAEGYSLRLVDGRVQFNLVKRWLDDALRVETREPLAPRAWHHIVATYNASRAADGVRIFVDGRSEPLVVQLDELNQSFLTTQPFRIGGGGGPDARFHGRIDDVGVFSRALSSDEAELVATPETITQILELAPGARSDGQAHKLRAWYLENQAPEPIHRAHRELIDIRKRRDHLVESFPTTMVMQEQATPREAFMLVRGRYDQPGEKVTRGVPACLGAPPSGAPENRLGLARWVVDPANPLTARVAVNRMWQMFFGTGLVKTVDDFGTQGESPTYPELLDWLALEQVRSGWDMKAIHRLIVCSATYRQSSRATADLLRRDPENRLLARGPRFRLSAEMIRDQALAISGLLVERLGGPSVRPYQPDGLWKELAEIKEYQQDHGASLYRRGLYTFWKRTVAPPSLMLFDASGREACAVRETRTNTPLQALTLLNDVTFVEASRVLAQRAIKQGGTTPDSRIEYLFRLATSRDPVAREQEIMVKGLRDHLARFQCDRGAALELISVGESQRDQSLDPSEHAAYTAMASLVLNLDEVVTKD